MNPTRHTDLGSGRGRISAANKYPALSAGLCHELLRDKAQGTRMIEYCWFWDRAVIGPERQRGFATAFLNARFPR